MLHVNALHIIMFHVSVYSICIVFLFECLVYILFDLLGGSPINFMNNSPFPLPSNQPKASSGVKSLH